MAKEELSTIIFTFSGHDSFQCRHLWLKKGYDFVNQNKPFKNDDAVVELGVGKNMASSIPFWMKLVLRNEKAINLIWLPFLF